MAQAARKLGGLVKGTFRGIVVIQRGASPRIVRADVVGSGGRTRGHRQRSCASASACFDTWAYFTEISSHKEDPEKTPSTDPSADEGGTPPAAHAAAADGGGVLAGRVVPVRRGRGARAATGRRALAPGRRHARRARRCTAPRSPGPASIAWSSAAWPGRRCGWRASGWRSAPLLLQVATGSVSSKGNAAWSGRAEPLCAEIPPIRGFLHTEALRGQT